MSKGDTTMTIIQPADRVKQRLIRDLEEAAQWRRRKSLDHPDDVRNVRSADALDQMAHHVASLPANDPRLLTVAHATSGWANEAGFFTESLNRVAFHHEAVDLHATLTSLVHDAICALMSDGIEVDNHEARDWLAEKITDALDEAKAGRSFTDVDDRPAHDRRITALSNLLSIVRSYQTTAPPVEKAKVLCVADRARGLHPNTWSSLNELCLHRPQRRRVARPPGSPTLGRRPRDPMNASRVVACGIDVDRAWPPLAGIAP
jgi:hypothetical protein